MIMYSSEYLITAARVMYIFLSLLFRILVMLAGKNYQKISR